MSETKFTPGPWRWEISRASRKVELCGGGVRVGTYDWRVLSFRRWGTQDAQPEFWTWEGNVGTPQLAKDLAEPVKGREHHADWFADINHPDARLIAAAPALYDACKAALSTHGCEVSEPGLPSLKEVEGMLRSALLLASEGGKNEPA